MRSLITGFVAVLSLATWPRFACGQAQGQRHARVELLSESATVAPSQQVWMGVHFVLENSWHIYWINPGDSGQPPVFEWKLPEGFRAGSAMWPAPEKLRNGTLADYGYKDDVMLLVPVHAPGQIRDDRVEVSVLVRWLVCREVCIAEREQLSLTIPIARTAVKDPSRAPGFAAARARLPRPWPKAWKASALSTKGSFILAIHAGQSIRDAEFLPLEPNQIENAAPQPLKSTPGGAIITLKKSDQLFKPAPALKGLLRLGKRRSYQVEVRVTQETGAIDRPRALQPQRHNPVVK